MNDLKETKGYYREIHPQPCNCPFCGAERKLKESPVYIGSTFLLAMDGSEMARKLRDAQDYLENASNGLVHHIPEKSPIMKDIMAANAAMEEVRLCLLAKE